MLTFALRVSDATALHDVGTRRNINRLGFGAVPDGDLAIKAQSNILLCEEKVDRRVVIRMKQNIVCLSFRSANKRDPPRFRLGVGLELNG